MNKPEHENARVLVVEDEPQMAEGLRFNFELEGYEVRIAPDGESGLAEARAWAPGVVILDLMLPGLGGLEVLRILRKEGVWTPVVILTAKNQEADVVAGLEAGADDYVPKPFSLAELLARVRAVVRRSNQTLGLEQDVIALGSTAEVDFRKYEVRRGGKAYPLSRFEAEILRYLISRQGEVVSREEFLRDVWGYSILPTTRTVDNHVARIRKKVEESPDQPVWIQTVHGIGYRMSELGKP